MPELSAVFVGRESEIQWLLEGFGSIPHRFAARLVTGSSGLGKTALLQEAVRRIHAVHPDALVLAGGCEEQEQVAYRAFSAVLDSLGRWFSDLPREERLQMLPRHASILSRVFPALCMLSELESETGVHILAQPEPGEARQIAFMALREFLGRIADRRPVAVFLDDMQWADEDSLRLLETLVQSPGAPPIFLSFALRTHIAGVQTAQILARLEKVPTLQTLRLRPLAMEDSLSLIRGLLQANPEFREVEPQAASRIAREAGGQPLFIYELLYHLRVVGDSPKSTLKLEDVLWSRISVLDEDFISLLELVCISFGPVRMDFAAAVLERSVGEVFRITARLRMLHLVRVSGPRPEDMIEPYHDRIRETLMEHMDAARATIWHERIVRELEALPDVNPERMASHLVCLERTRQAADFLAKAARQAVRQLAFDRAAGLWIQAIQLRFPEGSDVAPEDVEDLRAWMIDCAQALWGAGRGRDSALLLLRAAEGLKNPESLGLRRQAAERLMVSGYLDEGIEVSRGIAENLGVHLPRFARKAALSLFWSRIRVRLRGVNFVHRDERDLPPQSLLYADILASLARGLALSHHILGADCSARYLLRALDLGEPRRVLEALTLEANFAASSSVKSPYVQRILDVVEAQKDLCRDFSSDVFIHAAHGYVDYMNGDWMRARENARAAFRLWNARPGTFWERTLMRLQICWSSYYLGEMAQLSLEVPAVVREAEDRGDLFTFAGMVTGLNNTVFLNAEGFRNALARVEEVMARWSHGGYHMQHYFALLARVQAHLFAMDPASAAACIGRDERDLRRSWLLRVPSVRHEYWQFCAKTAILEALSCPAWRREKLRAAESWAKKACRSQLPWVQGTGHAILGAAAHARGDHETAVARLRQALERFQFSQMGLYAAAARLRLSVLVQGDEGQKMAQEARAFLAEQDIRREENWLSLLMPGFSG